MVAPRTITIFLISVFAAEVLAESCLIISGSLALSDSWRLFIFVAIGTASYFLGKHQPATPVLCMLLASMAVLVSGADLSAFSEDLGQPLGAVFRFLWSALLWLFGFSFVHFSLIFPIKVHWIRQHIKLVWFIYIPYFLLLAISELFLEIGLASAMQLLLIVVGILLGLVILIRKYIFSLTSAEKNRLLVVLIGCLAGALPTLLAVISAVLLESRHNPVLEFGLFMLPLFPLGMVAAVLKENFSEISRWIQRTLIYSLAVAGSITIFFFSYWLMILLERETGGFPVDPLVLSAALAIVLIFPLIRYSSSYISTRFYATEVSDEIKEIALPPFQRIEPNPYIVGNPIRSSEDFFGREEDFRYIRTVLSSESQGCVIMLCGDRRTGKTSILFQIMNGRLGSDFIPVFIDMQGMVVQKDAEFLRELAARIREVMKSRLPINGSSLNIAIASYTDFNHFMDALATVISHRRLVILVDEYELIETKVKDAKLGAEIFGYLDSLLVRYPWLSYVFTGSKSLEFSGAWTAILARAVYRKISFLARKDAQALICLPLKHKVIYPAGIVNDLLRLTNGHPFFTQVVCQNLVEELNDTQSNVVGRKSVDEAFHRVLENPPPQLFYQWTTFTDAEKIVLSALATLLKKADGYLLPERVEKMIRSLPGQVMQQMDVPVIQMHLENLREKDIIDRDQTRYRFVMDLMRLWIQSEHNIWKVLSEVGKGSVKTKPS